MVQSCSVVGCPKVGKIHRLPRDPEFRLKWVAWLSLDNLPEEKEDGLRVCDAHFEPEYQVPGTRRGLRCDAVPTLRCGLVSSQPASHSVPAQVRDTYPQNGSPSLSVLNKDPAPAAVSVIQPADMKVELSQSSYEDSAIVLNGSVNAHFSAKDLVVLGTAAELGHFTLCSSDAVQASTGVNGGTSVVKTSTSEIASEVTNETLTTSPLGIYCEDFDKICRICLRQSSHLERIGVKTIAWKYIETCAAIKVSSDDGLPRNICRGCKKTLDQTYMFINRFKCSHQFLWNLKEKEKSLIKDDNLENSESSICSECHKSFATQKQLNRHMRIHSADQQGCEKCGKIYKDRDSLSKHFLMKHSENRIKPYKCAQCAMSFDVRTTLIRHLRTHSGERPFACDVCHKLYPSKSYLLRHKKIHEPVRERLFICEFCSKSFITKDSLSAHLATHSDRRPFQCTLCDKSFTTNSSLQSHIKYIHTKEKNHMCQVCGKLFTTSSGLNCHLQRHNGETKPASHACSMCFKKLSSAAHLRLHVRAVHIGERPYGCDYCPKKFVTPESLKVHRRYHTGETPFACTFCTKSFATNGNRKVHERVHTGEKPYKCSLCDCRFTQSGTLKSHMRSH